MIERLCVFAPLEEDSRHRGEVVLESVVAARKQARAQCDLKHLVLENYLVPVFQATGALENLHSRIGAVHLDDLRHKMRSIKVDVADFVLRHRSVHCDSDKV